MASMVSGRSSLGWGLVDRTRRTPATAPAAAGRSADQGRREDLVVVGPLVEDLHHRALGCGPLEQRRGPPQVVGAEHGVDLGGALADELAVLLGEAAPDCDLQVGSAVLLRLQVSQVAVE